MDNIRYNVSPCTRERVRAFVDSIDKSVYELKSAVTADEHSHYDRYSLLCDVRGKVAIVFDTIANVVSITAPEARAEELLSGFAPAPDQTVKRSTVPAQKSSIRAKVFDLPKPKTPPMTSVILTANGAEVSTDEVFPPQIPKNHDMIFTSAGKVMPTDEIYPPQIIKRGDKTDKQKQPPRSSHLRDEAKPFNDIAKQSDVRNGKSLSAEQSKPDERRSGATNASITRNKTAIRNGESGKKQNNNDDERVGIAITTDTAGRRSHKTVNISFGDEETDARKPRIAPTGGTGVFSPDKHIAQNTLPQVRNNSMPSVSSRLTATPAVQINPFSKSVRPTAAAPTMPPAVPEYKNGYSVKNYAPAALDDLLKRLSSRDGYKVIIEPVEAASTAKEVKTFTVTDSVSQKVVLRYATKKQTLQLQGKRCELFAELQAEVSGATDYSSALENYVEMDAVKSTVKPKTKVSAVQKELKKRLPTAIEFLSEQSMIDFSYGIHDFAQNNLAISDYSVLLVPPYRGLERFVIDLQRAEGIEVKMIGQAYEKDDNGNYILKRGYQRKIGSVVYGEVMVALYTEYFSHRNFFAHADNSNADLSRSIPDKTEAKKVLDNLLDLVEYNSKKLKEIGFSVDRNN